jgi:hypothetical protein
MKNLGIKEKAADYSLRFPKTTLSSADYEKFIRTSFSILPPPKETLEERLKKSPRVKFKLY